MDEKAEKIGVYKAIVAVQGDLAKEGISKDRTCTQGATYKFRGIDDVYNALAPFLSKHGLCILPRILSRECIERTSKSGGALFYTTIEAEFDFVSAEDGSRHTVRTYGEAMDSGDKGCNKSMSAAYKYAAFQTFCIPTEGDNDEDATTHEVKAQRYAQTKQANAHKIAELREQVSAKPFNPEVCPPAEDISDLEWGNFLDYVGDDPDRTKIGKKVKAKMSIGEMSLLPPKGRRAVMLSIQDEATRQGVPFSEWVKA